MKQRSRRSPLQTFLTEHKIDSFADALAASQPRPDEGAARGEKKNYAERLSDAFAVLIAECLREYFPSILPTSDGGGNESPARTGKGVKMLDVNYSTPQLGLGLGVSIKTLNFKDPRTKRYTKNPTRIDNELRAESMDYHDRQPFSVLVGIVLVPADAADDGNSSNKRGSWSSFAQIVNVLRHRVGRRGPKDEVQLFEKGFVGLYEYKGAKQGEVVFFDIEDVPPQFGRPSGLYDLNGLVRHIVLAYDARNNMKRAWETKEEEVVPFARLLAEDRIPSTEAEDDDSI